MVPSCYDGLQFFPARIESKFIFVRRIFNEIGSPGINWRIYIIESADKIAAVAVPGEHNLSKQGACGRAKMVSSTIVEYIASLSHILETKRRLFLLNIYIYRRLIFYFNNLGRMNDMCDNSRRLISLVAHRKREREKKEKLLYVDSMRIKNWRLK